MLRYIILLCLLLIILFIYLITIRNDGGNNIAPTSITLEIYENITYNTNELPKKNNVRNNVHVPKFMLELYENNKNKINNYTIPEVVRSVIPKSAGNVFSF